jgi:hypothetical protein
MTYRNYTISRGVPELLPDGRRIGHFDIVDPNGVLIDVAEYPVGNSFARALALLDARRRVDRAVAASGG